jgi:hypothetical protein
LETAQLAEIAGEWFAVKGLFRWYFKDTGDTGSVEERIILFWAENFDQAIEYAEQEAVKYCEEDPAAKLQIEALGWWDAYRIMEEQVGHGVEIYSRLADTSLSGEAFIRRYYPKSQDRTTKEP